MFSTRPLLIFTPKIPALEHQSTGLFSAAQIDILPLSCSATHLCLNSREFFPHQPARLTAATLATHSLVCSATFTALNTELRHLNDRATHCCWSSHRLSSSGDSLSRPSSITAATSASYHLTSARLFSPSSVERRIPTKTPSSSPRSSCLSPRHDFLVERPFYFIHHRVLATSFASLHQSRSPDFPAHVKSFLIIRLTDTLDVSS